MSANADHALPRTTPEQQGIASTALLAFVAAVERQIFEVHSFMLLRHGCVVAEGWWSPCAPEHPHMLFSVSKSFTSTAVGLALAEGYFSIDDPVISFFPAETPADVSEFLAAMRVRHLLTMSTGHAVDTWSNLFDRLDGGWIKGFFEVPVLHAPGSHFLYNTGASYMLAAIVQKTTGMKLIDFLQSRFFEPLGIKNASWQESPEGIAMGGIGLSLRTEDIARFGQFYLQKGEWQGRQILPQEWVEAAAGAQISNGDDPESDWSQGYGYQFWRCRHGAYRGDGVFGQYCIVMPEQDAVLAITGGMDIFEMQQPLNLIWDLLLPAIGAAPLPEDAAAQRQLSEKLSTLRFPTPAGQGRSPISAQVSGRVYHMDANDRGIETLTLNFDDSGCVVDVKTAAGDERISCGFGRWQQGGRTALFRDSWLADPTPIAASSAWTADDCLMMVIRLYETPFFHTLIFHFAGEELMIEMRVNTSFEPTEALLTGQAR